jgi:hypothetical protein
LNTVAERRASLGTMGDEPSLAEQCSALGLVESFHEFRIAYRANEPEGRSFVAYATKVGRSRLLRFMG